MKRISLCFVMVLITFMVNAQIPTEGLVGYWPFNGNANDATCNGNDGIVNGVALVEDRFGNPNCAYSFDGLDDYIEVLHDDIISTVGKNNFTFTVWAKRDSLSRTEELICKGYPGDPENLEINISFTIDNYFQGAWESYSGAADYAVNSYTAITDSAWHLYTVTFDGDSLKIFVDSIFVGYNTGVIAPDIGLERSLIIGAWNSSGTYQRHFKGSIDDIRIFESTLNASEIQALYNEGLCFETIYDTIEVFDTTFITVYDTITTDIFDTTTVTVYDTVLISVNDTLIIPLYTDVDPLPSDNIDNNLLVYPNPASSVLNIELDQPDAYTYSLAIRNSVGQVLFEDNSFVYFVQLDITEYNTGLYFVDITNDETGYTTTRKIVFE
jgi:hypothetical protein